MPSMYEIIKRKQLGFELSESEIKQFIEGYTNGDIPDYQAAALLMAIFFQGMSYKETVFLTRHMATSGHVIDLSSIPGFKVDKHSTGGVGDKATLVSVPLAAACGEKVAKFSGRGLGHTGGTIDKLESIPGFKTELTLEEFIATVQKVGAAIAGATDDIAPADKKLYALRDVTATIQSIPLIASSVMSKKLASGANGIVLDIKCGSGAFMKDVNEAKSLAKTMIDIGINEGRKVVAYITNMDSPLGFTIGNALEVAEAVETLQGRGPQDLVDLCVAQGAMSLHISTGEGYNSCKQKIQSALEDGSAYQKLLEIVDAQGGDISYIENLDKLLSNPDERTILSLESGYISHMQTEQIGLASVKLGAGRMIKTDPIDKFAGITLHKKTGDKVEEGEKIATFYAASDNRFATTETRFNDAQKMFLGSLKFSNEKPEEISIIIETLV